jgi:preprotein translocase subunit SecA
MYKKLAGMTGTALTSAEEFDKVYNLEVIVIPTHKPMIRVDLPDRVYKTNKAKFKAVVEEVKKRHQKGQPVLVGTVSIEKNEFLGKLLEREGIPHQILNAKNHEKEGEIIAQAGRLGAVTVATNMAGRGVDIILGGNPPDPEEAEKVKKLGGLHIIGTERHEARRIDNQLRGRAGRQGDPGSTQFFLSLEDDLLRVFGGDQIKSLLERFEFPEDESIENKMLTNIIESAQSKIEAMNFDLRKHLLEYDDVLNKHREVFYKKRRTVLQKENLKEEILSYLKKEIDKIVELHCQDLNPREWNIEEIVEEMKTIFPAPGDLHSKLNEFIDKKEREKIIREIKDSLFDLINKNYREKEEKIGSEQMRKLEKLAILQSLDFHWSNHLENMEYLRDAVRLRAYGQRDPLVEYKKEGYLMFQNLLNNVEHQVARTIFKVVPIERKEETVKVVHLDRKKKVGRNDPCPCGSGKKYKKCCWPKYG